jgi:hypothetical protein
MPDDLDQLIRAAMKTLDEQVPSGYFEALPNQTLARLEGSMQHGSSGTTETRDKVAPPPITASPVDQEVPTPMVKPIMDQDREEDSGLHDIRNLAQSTKQRLSKRSITSPPAISDDDVLAASSGSFKNIALPQPARMVSLPSVDELPSKAEIAAAEKAAKEAAKKAAKEAKDSQKTKPADPVVAAASAPAVEVPVVAATAPARSAFTLPSQQRKSSKGPLLAIVGLGLAAAAGGVIFLQVNKNKEAAAPSAASESAKQDTAAVTATPIAGATGSAAAAPAVAAPDPAPAAPPPVEEAKAAEAPAEAQLATDNVKDADDKADAKKRAKPSKGAKTKVEKETPKVEEQKPVEKTEPKKPVATKGGEGEGEPSFDALLKEAGVSDQKKEAKPKLDKKSLTGDDFKKGMASVASKAKGCYKGTQGTAMVKLTVSPSGSVSKLSVSGEFAGKPEGSCVEAALKSASFPPWDGGPQSFTYSVLLSD